MKYRVTRYFEDALDGNYPYSAGDSYPRAGLKPTKKRIEELSGENNAMGTPLIVPESESKKKKGE